MKPHDTHEIGILNHFLKIIQRGQLIFFGKRIQINEVIKEIDLLA